MHYIGQIFICRGGVLTMEKTTPMIPHFYGLMLKWMSIFTYQMVFTGLLHMSERPPPPPNSKSGVWVCATLSLHQETFCRGSNLYMQRHQ